MSAKKQEIAARMIENLARKSILDLVPYSSARNEFSGKASILLDANENTRGSALNWAHVDSDLNRYPDPLQIRLRTSIANYFSKSLGLDLRVENIFAGNGSDEAIDLLMRAFCEPNQDPILITPPTYGMYEVIANIQGVPILRAALDSNFNLIKRNVDSALQHRPKITFICSPNNPTANSFPFSSIKRLAKAVRGLLVVDEAYIDFSEEQSAISLISQHPNVVVLRTLSKAWGAAGIRVGFAIAHPRIISLLHKIKAPYNLSSLAQSAALEVIANKRFHASSVAKINSERERLSRLLTKSQEVEKVFPSHASFLLVRFFQPAVSFAKLIKNGIVVRDRSQTPGCEGCFRIAVGTPEENDALLVTLGVNTKSKDPKKSKRSKI